MSAAEQSIRGELEAALKSQREPEQPETSATNDTAEIVTSASDSPTETTKSTQERTRDAQGRFVSADRHSETGRDGGGNGEGSAAAETGDQGQAAKAATSAAPAETAAKAETQSSLAPPNGWPAEAKAKWHELPPEIMAAVQKREQDVAKFTSTRDEHASFGKEIYQTVQPYLATIKAEGGTATTAIQSLLNTAYVLRTGTPDQKRNALLQAAQHYGVDLGVKPSGQQPNAPNPEFASLQAEIAALKNQLATFQNAGEQQLRAEVDAELEAFAADPKHPHYESVKAHMAALLGAGAAKDLQDAYDQAVYARPDTRATLLAQQRAEEEQKRRAEAKQKAEEAKRKNVSLTGGPGNTAAASAPAGRSIRDELLAAQAAQSGAV